MQKEPLSATKPAKANPTLGRSPIRRGMPITLDDIRTKAFQKWVAAGKPDSDGVRFWREAEQELLAAN
jgi:hypothetical protein